MDFAHLDTLSKCRSRRKTLRNKFEKLIAKGQNVAVDPSRVCEYENLLKVLEQAFLQVGALQDKIIDLVGADESASAEDLREEEEYLEPLHDEFMTIASSLQTVIRTSQELLTDTLQFPKRAPSCPPASNDVFTKLLEQNAKLIEMMAVNQTAQPSFTGVSQALQLPTLEPIKFRGLQEDWASFRSTWEAIIERSNMTEEQKMKLLKDAVRGGAAESRLRHFDISAGSYQHAWGRLCSAYGRLKSAVSAYISAFLKQAPCRQDDVVRSLQRLHDTSDGLIRSIASLGEGAGDRDFWLIELLMEKLDDGTRTAWSLHTVNNDKPSFSELLKFIESRSNALRTRSSIGKRSEVIRDESRKQAVSIHRTHATGVCVCVYCGGPHRVYSCDSFKALSTDARRKSSAEKGMCFNCLSTGHLYRNCASKGRCAICRGVHHTLLHVNTANGQIASSSARTNSMVAAGSTVTAHQTLVVSERSKTSDLQVLTEPECNSQTRCLEVVAESALLPTAIAEVKDSRGCWLRVRILLDSASTVSFITERCAQALGSKRQHARIPVNGMSDTPAGTTRGKTNLRLMPVKGNSSFEIDLLVMTRITGKVPAATLNRKQFEQFDILEPADPEFYKPVPIDVLLGADAFMYVLRDGRISLGDGRPVAQNSIFGWLISGKVRSSKYDDIRHSAVTCIADLDIDRLLHRFFEMDEPVLPKLITPQDGLVEQHFRETHTRDKTGRYVVRLPFNEKKECLGRNINAVTRAFRNIEGKFRVDSELKSQYVAFIRDFIQQGHMEKIPQVNIERECCTYLPHLAVLKENSSTTKLRTVFNASCRTEKGVSLNDALYTGPVLQRSLRAILRCFRLHRIALVADIKQMYRMIRVHADDAEYQRIIWRENAQDPIEHYRITVLTYGTAPASYIATKVLQEAAAAHRDEFTKAAEIIQRDFYMDDMLSGCESVAEAIELRSQIRNILQSVGFHLRKWASNDAQVVSAVPSEDRAVDFKQIKSDGTIGALGVDWHPASDIFAFTIKQFDASEVTRRVITSKAAKIFDPLGFLAPITVALKIIIQETWITKLDWDQPLPIHLYKRWMAIRNETTLLNSIRIQRWVGITRGRSFQLHGFADASTRAYCAAIYIRVTDNQHTHTNLLEARTRIAPPKPVTLARLELCAALLLAELIREVLDSIPDYSPEIITWTDSANVLFWLSSHPSKWATFVANRTAKIISIVPANQWRHVSGKENPADCATRGMYPSELIRTPMWLAGPEWLGKAQDQWPVTCVTMMRDDVLQSYVIGVEPSKQNCIADSFIYRYSSLERLSRITAWCFRFYQALRHRVNKKNMASSDISRNLTTTEHTAQTTLSPGISATELQRALAIYIRESQAQSFTGELECIRKKKPLMKASPLRLLCPLIDGNGVLRVYGRLQRASTKEADIQPIIISAKSQFALLLVRHTHEKLLHAGPLLMLTSIRRDYWLIGGRNLTRKVYRECVICRRINGSTMQQRMGELPTARVTPAPAFYRTGVDYAGPFLLRNIYGRATRNRKQDPHKAYIVLFVCMSTRAIHLELASDLTTETFLAAFKRFVSRRGKPAEMFSDRGTNFVGARNKLKELNSFLCAEDFGKQYARFAAENGIRWSLMPPLSPNFGGIWEANIKCMKKHLEAVLRIRTLNYEEFYTLLTLVEACLNSRPLCGNTTSTEQIDPLTPGHLLIGRPLTAVPEIYNKNAPDSHLDRWTRVQRVADEFWERWREEYLLLLQKRTKWKEAQENVQPGDIVVVRNEELPSTKWPLARVVQIHPGPDGLVRVVTLTDGRKIFQRNIRRLVRLVEDRGAVLAGGMLAAT